MEYNGWKNKETWLVNIWYRGSMLDYFADMEVYHVEANELQEAATYIVEECEALSQLPYGLLSDFIDTCWSKVDWYSLVEHLNASLKKMQG